MAVLVAGALAGCVADGPPVIGTVVAGEGEVTLSWAAPTSDAVQKVTAYVVTPHVNGLAQPSTRFSSTATTQTVVGLTGGVTYRFSVEAVSAVGSLSAPSATSAPVVPAGPSLATGGTHTCAVRADGTLRCWGSNATGQLGNGASLPAASTSTPASVTGISTATSVAAGGDHSCATLSGGSIKCWGANWFGQLGSGTASPSSPGGSSVPVAVVGITNATAVTVGAEHTCARLAGGTVKCWGQNADGQLGNGSTVESATPVTVVGITDATAVAAGGRHTCARLAGGAVKCWGSNEFDQGAGGSGSVTPVTRVGVTGATTLTTGPRHSCARLQDGTVRCWGDNGNGEVGSSGGGVIAGIATAADVTSGGTLYEYRDNLFPAHTCARLASGALRCWGDNTYGQLGNGQSLPGGSTPTPVAVDLAGAQAITVAGGGVHTCVRLSNRTVRCWGSNGYGQLGNGAGLPGPSSSTPVVVTGL